MYLRFINSKTSISLIRSYTWHKNGIAWANWIRLITNRSPSSEKGRRKWEKRKGERKLVGRSRMWREREGGRERKKYGSKRHTRCQRGTVCPLFTGVTAGWNCHCLKICLHRGLKYTVGIRPNDDRSPSFFHLLSPRERHCSASMEPKEGEGETSSRSCFNFVPMCRWRNVCVLSLWQFTRLPPPPHEKWKEIFPHCTSRNRYRDNSDVIDRGELKERIGHWYWEH